MSRLSIETPGTERLPDYKLFDFIFFTPNFLPFRNILTITAGFQRLSEGLPPYIISLYWNPGHCVDVGGSILYSFLTALRKHIKVVLFKRGITNHSQGTLQLLFVQDFSITVFGFPGFP